MRLLNRYPISLFILSTLFLLNTTASAATQINELKTYYKITGSTANELREQMNKMGPVYADKHYDAETKWYVRWQYYWNSSRSSQKSCSITSVNVSADITFLFPDWVNKNDAPLLLQDQWNLYMLSLDAHERGHAINGINAAHEIESVIKNMQPASNCTELESNINHKTKEIITKYINQDRQYDQDTDHGKRQGVVFPPKR